MPTIDPYAHPPDQQGFIARVSGRTFYTDPLAIPGIGTGAAYTALDAMGSPFQIVNLPASGIIQGARWFDLDDEGIAKEIWCFKSPIAGTADNGAFAPTDIELLTLECIISIANFKDASVNQMGVEDGLGLSFVCPQGIFYCQVKTLGADNIAAANLPMIALRILPD